MGDSGWEPEPAELRDGEKRDDEAAHSRQNLKLLRQASESGDLPDELEEQIDDRLEAAEEVDDGV